MSPAVNVELEEVPFAILETVKARILANRRRLGLSQQQGRPRPSTRPRAQFRKTGASSKGWRKPQHGAGALEDTPFFIGFYNVNVIQDDNYTLRINDQGVEGYMDFSFSGELTAYVFLGGETTEESFMASSQAELIKDGLGTSIVYRGFFMLPDIDPTSEPIKLEMINQQDNRAGTYGKIYYASPGDDTTFSGFYDSTSGKSIRYESFDWRKYNNTFYNF